MVWLVVSVVVFIALSGMMAAVEAALLSVTHPEVDELISQRRAGARRLEHLKRELPRTLAVIVIATNLINVLGPILVSRRAFAEFGTAALVPITIVLTVGTIVFSEVIPKSLGSHYAPLLARRSAHIVHLMGLCIYPLAAGLARLSNSLTREPRRIGTEAQIRALVRLGSEAGHIEPHEGRMIFRSFRLNDRPAAAIMTPLPDVIALPVQASVGEAAELIREREFSRYPVFGESPHDVRGWLIARDVLQWQIDGKSADPIEPLLRPRFCVDENTLADELLVEFRTRHEHLAVVRREEETIGIVTLEDVLEEIVGEIEDERDIAARR